LEAAAPLALPAVAAPLGYAGLGYAGLGYAGVPAGLGYAGVPAGLAYGAGAVAHPHVLPVGGAVGAYPYAAHGLAGAYPGAYGAYPGAYAGYPYAAPAVAAAEVVRSAPAVADAELHTVKLNPGHATAYRVY